MKLRIDAQLSPGLARWLSDHHGVEAIPVRSLGLLDATDEAIFDAACNAGAVVMTKDRDFVQLLDRAGPPPQVLWITCGNTSNARMRDILRRTIANALLLLREGEPYVEITDST